MSSIIFRTNTASEHEILTHLSRCDYSFIPSLSSRVDLASYSKAIIQKATTFEAWDERTLAGLVAAYFNDTRKRTGYITNMSVLTECTGKGIASKLLLECISYAMNEQYREIRLEVNRLNSRAISLYRQHDFVATSLRGDTITMKYAVPL